ncbi:hypothetical protein D3C77_458070 [compost metagenome]
MTPTSRCPDEAEEAEIINDGRFVDCLRCIGVTTGISHDAALVDVRAANRAVFPHIDVPVVDIGVVSVINVRQAHLTIAFERGPGICAGQAWIQTIGRRNKQVVVFLIFNKQKMAQRGIRPDGFGYSRTALLCPAGAKCNDQQQSVCDVHVQYSLTMA